MSYFVANFYQFVEPTTPLDELRDQLIVKCEKWDILGTILLSPEGANFSLSAEHEQIKVFIEWLNKSTVFDIKDYRKSSGDQKPFPRLKINIQESIITFLGEQDPSVEKIHEGGRLEPQEWQEYIDNNKDIVLVDTRNDYEVEWGTFENAEHFPIKNFSEFPAAFQKKFKMEEYKDKVFLFFCTGGIRCEKVAAWAKDIGIDKAFQLEGGILRYLEEHKNKSWNGDCFVFDRRWALDQNANEVHGRQHKKEITQPKQYFDKDYAEHFSAE